MNRIRLSLLGTALLLAPIVASAQIEQCAAMYVMKKHSEANPLVKSNLAATEENAKTWRAGYKGSNTAVITIPTVFHVIYHSSMPDQNIPDSVIYSQIDVLNEDFRRMNADTGNTRAIFDSIAADIQIEFCLASKDPQGDTTNGINRISSTETGFDIFFGMDNMKYTASGGADAWPASSYYNIWICNLTLFGSPGGVLGFAQFPGDSAATDGVVLQYNYVGRTNDPIQSDSSLGRTATHETGHWLGLRHIWADDGNPFTGVATCDSSDFVDDTPNQKGASNYDCVTAANSCSNETAYWGLTDPPDMVENYMDYSSDDCSNLFTKGQKTRMLSFLNTDRVGLLTSDGCSFSPTGIADNELLVNSISLYPNPTNGKFALLSDKRSSIRRVIIVNHLGQNVLELLTNDVGSAPIEIDLSSFISGIYIARIYSSEGITTKKLILNQ